MENILAEETTPFEIGTSDEDCDLPTSEHNALDSGIDCRTKCVVR